MVINKSGYEFVGPAHRDINGWKRVVRVGEIRYSVSLQRGKRVRIPYKPRGQNWGFKWVGSVYCMDGDKRGYLYNDEVPKSTGCRGLLLAAGVINVDEYVRAV